MLHAKKAACHHQRELCLDGVRELEEQVRVEEGTRGTAFGHLMNIS